MNEKITHISVHFMEDDHIYQAKIVIDGVATPHYVEKKTVHYVEKKTVPDQKEFAMIALADALGYEPANLLNFECLELKGD